MARIKYIVLTAIIVAALSGCAPDQPDEPLLDIATVDSAALTDTLPAPGDPAVLTIETGEATYYADVFDRQRTASGELLDQDDLVAAHRRFPFGTIARVTNVNNDRTVEVRIIDRGPFGAPKVAAQKVIDLSRRAASEIGIIREGRAVVRVEVLSYGSGAEI